MVMAKIIEIFRKHEEKSKVKLLGMMQKVLTDMKAGPELQQKILPDGKQEPNQYNIIELFFHLDIGSLGWAGLLFKTRKELDPFINAVNLLNYETDNSCSNYFNDLTYEKHLEYTAIEKCLKILTDNIDTLFEYIGDVGSLLGQGDLVTRELQFYYEHIKEKNKTFDSLKNTKRDNIDKAAKECLDICKENIALQLQIENATRLQAKLSFEEILNIEKKLLANEENLKKAEDHLKSFKDSHPTFDILKDRDNALEIRFDNTVVSKQDEIAAIKAKANVTAILASCAKLRSDLTIDIATVKDIFSQNQLIIETEISSNKTDSKELKEALKQTNAIIASVNTGIQQKSDIIKDLQKSNTLLSAEIKHIDEKIMIQPNSLYSQIINTLIQSSLKQSAQHITLALNKKPPDSEKILLAHTQQIITKLTQDLAETANSISALMKQRDQLIMQKRNTNFFVGFVTDTLPQLVGAADESQNINNKIYKLSTETRFFNEKLSALENLKIELEKLVTQKDTAITKYNNNKGTIVLENARMNKFENTKSDITQCLANADNKIAKTKEAILAEQQKPKNNPIVVARQGLPAKDIEALQLINEYIKNRCEKTGKNDNKILSDFLLKYKDKIATIKGAAKNDDISKALKYISTIVSPALIEKHLKNRIEEHARSANKIDKDITEALKNPHANTQKLKEDFMSQKTAYINSVKALYRMGATELCNEIIGNPNKTATIKEKQKIAVFSREYSIEGGFDIFRKKLANQPQQPEPQQNVHPSLARGA